MHLSFALWSPFHYGPRRTDVPRTSCAVISRHRQSYMQACILSLPPSDSAYSRKYKKHPCHPLTKGANTRYHLHLSLSDPGTFRYLSVNGDKTEALTAVFRISPKNTSALRLQSHVPQFLSEGISQLPIPLSGGGPCVLFSVLAFIYIYIYTENAFLHSPV